MQRAKRPGLCSAIAGSTAAQASVARGQRARKAQPAGSAELPLAIPTPEAPLLGRMLQGRYRVTGLAAEAGFFDQAHLGRLFRRRFGVTPAAYRRQVATT